MVEAGARLQSDRPHAFEKSLSQRPDTQNLKIRTPKALPRLSLRWRALLPAVAASTHFLVRGRRSWTSALVYYNGSIPLKNQGLAAVTLTTDFQGGQGLWGQGFEVHKSTEHHDLTEPE